LAEGDVRDAEEPDVAEEANDMAAVAAEGKTLDRFSG
jgi:hypothetical protein